VLRAEGDVAGARDRLEAALAAAPGYGDARVELADLLVADGRDLDRAEALLGGAAPGTPRQHLVLARLAEARGDDAGAAVEYALALAEEDDPDVRFRRALVLERKGRLDEATEELERVRAARPEDPLVRGRLAERYEAAGRLTEAEAELRFLADGDPERAAHWDRLARFYERTGRAKDAREADGRARAAAARPERELRPLLPSRR
jgi:predicted Zn-dependent protease